MLEWEQVTDDGTTWRLRVPGGWVVRYSDDVIHDHPVQGMIGGWDWRSSLTYVPDWSWEWNTKE